MKENFHFMLLYEFFGRTKKFIALSLGRGKVPLSLQSYKNSTEQAFSHPVLFCAQASFLASLVLRILGENAAAFA